MNSIKKITFKFFISISFLATLVEASDDDEKSRASAASVCSGSGDFSAHGTVDDSSISESSTSLTIVEEISKADLKRLFREKFPELTDLTLLNNSAEKTIKMAKFFLKKFPTIKSLDLSHVKMGDKGVEELSPLLKRIQILNLADCNIGKKGVCRLAEKLKAVEDLNLSSNPIGLAGVHAIAGLKNLKDLELRDCNISDLGAAVLAFSGLKKTIKFLDLDGNRITGKGVNSLSHFKKLREIHLADNECSASDVVVFSGMKKLKVFIE